MKMPRTVEYPTEHRESRSGSRKALFAWLAGAVFYFCQYMLRSAPSVMMPQLSQAFNLSALGLASLIGLYYYGYSPFSLVAGAALDRLGPRQVMPVAAVVIALGALLFSIGSKNVASVGRLTQGVGCAFISVGTIYLASKNFRPTQAATLIGATQMFGMAGGSAGQFAVGPLIIRGLPWQTFWKTMGVISLGMGVVLIFALPKQEKSNSTPNSRKPILSAFGTVFGNPQSILCGLIAGLLFVATTIFSMTWGVRYLQEAHGMEYGASVMRSAAVPIGWIIGSPLLGFISDRLGRRKPVIIGASLVLAGCLAWILFGPRDVLPPYSLALVAGLASGAAMLPYTIIKEVNPPELSGTATGVVNFLNFTFSALLGPVFAWLLKYLAHGTSHMRLVHYQTAFAPLLAGVALAIVLTIFLKETGPAGSAARAGVHA